MPSEKVRKISNLYEISYASLGYIYLQLDTQQNKCIATNITCSLYMVIITHSPSVFAHHTHVNILRNSSVCIFQNHKVFWCAFLFLKMPSPIPLRTWWTLSIMVCHGIGSISATMNTYRLCTIFCEPSASWNRHLNHIEKKWFDE
jgi:hypothetical protein